MDYKEFFKLFDIEDDDIIAKILLSGNFDIKGEEFAYEMAVTMDKEVEGFLKRYIEDERRGYLGGHNE